MKRLLVTGSRTWTDEKIIFIELTRAAYDLDSDPTRNVVLVVGGARGADKIAEDIYRNTGGVVEIHKADWNRHGKQAGYIRNTKMVDSGVDLCLGFIMDDSKGATMTVNQCKYLGIETRIFRV